MSQTECDLPRLPSDAKDMLKRLLEEVRSTPPDASDSVVAAAKFSVGLLLPRFAGTMLKLLCEEGPMAATELMARAALFQHENPADQSVGFRLAVAMDYLRRTGCVDVNDCTIQIAPFGGEVYETRFRKTG